MDDKCPTGIPGFDELVGGGLPRNRTILLSGSCGTGKTIFALQYLTNGVEKYGEPGILLTLEQHSEELRKDARNFSIDLKKHEDQHKLIIIDTSLSHIGVQDYLTTIPLVPQQSFSLLPGEFDMAKIMNIILEASQKIGAKRVVIDSLPALDYMIKEKHDLRRLLININYELKKNGLTSILVTETNDEEATSKHGVEEYIADGVIILHTNEALDTRTIKIRKMRTTRHTLKPHTLEITEKGIIIKSIKGL